MAGLGIQFNDCFPEALRVGGISEHFMRSGLECPRVSRVLPWSVACSSSDVKRVAVRAMLFLTWSHSQTPPGSTFLQFERLPPSNLYSSSSSLTRDPKY